MRSLLVLFFYFKQKTAYEMRISDWSSDVCSSDLTTGQVAKAGFGAFLYLEILDVSFSFDGVIGAFALSNNLFIIAIGLCIGAMFVRSMMIFLVRQGTLSEYRYLEHGAFYAIIALAALMYINTFPQIPEIVNGLICAVL